MPFKDKEKEKEYKRRYYQEHKKEIYDRSIKWKKNNIDKVRESHRKYYHKTKEIFREHNIEKNKKYINSHRWIKHFHTAKSRCENINDDSYKNYGARGIKFLLVTEEIKELWFRDKAYEMDKPSIDRRDHDGNYEFDNCRFIEYSKNLRRYKKMKSKIIKMVEDELKSLSKIMDVSDSIKQMEKLRTDLEKGAEEKFKEIDRNKRKTFIRSKEIILD